MDNGTYFTSGLQAQQEIGAEALAAHEAAIVEAQAHAQAVVQASQAPGTAGMSQPELNADIAFRQSAIAKALREGSWKKSK